MTSTEKLLAFLEQLDEQPDSELAKMFPIPPSLMHMAIAGASARVPDDHAQLDDWALKAAEFCLSMRSDDAAPVEMNYALPEALPEPTP